MTHFRTSSNIYDHAPTKKLMANCEFFGYVKEDISFKNKHQLKAILEEKLYHSATDYKLTLKLSN